jgi:hypothetical protein
LHPQLIWPTPPRKSSVCELPGGEFECLIAPDVQQPESIAFCSFAKQAEAPDINALRRYRLNFRFVYSVREEERRNLDKTFCPDADECRRLEVKQGQPESRLLGFVNSVCATVIEVGLSWARPSS